MSKYRNGQLVSSIMREQNIYVTTTFVNGIQTIAEDNSLQIYPNPAQNTLSGTVNTAVPGPEDMLEIIAPDGRVVATDIPVKNGRFETDISHMAAGIYFLRLHNADEVLTQKFIKQWKHLAYKLFPATPLYIIWCGSSIAHYEPTIFI